MNPGPSGEAAKRVLANLAMSDQQSRAGVRWDRPISGREVSDIPDKAGLSPSGAHIVQPSGLGMFGLSHRALTMTPSSETMLRFVHQSNIDRYCKILETYLTSDERAFVEGRLAEEQLALQKLADEISDPK